MTDPVIGKDYYDSSDYFVGDAGHLTDRSSPFQRYRVRKVLEIYRPGQEERVADLGCGWGTMSFALAASVREVVGVDFSEKSVQLCNTTLKELEAPNVRFVCADAGATGLEAESFDVVLAADLFEHLYPEDSDRVYAEAARLLKPGGRFIIWTPHRGHFLEILKNRNIVLKRDVSHVDYKSMERIREGVVANGFAIEKAYYAESHLPLLRTVERILLHAVPLLRRRIAVLARRR